MELVKDGGQVTFALYLFMNLIFCPDCTDIVRLTKRTRNCSCGMSAGRLTSHTTAEYSGDAIPMALSLSELTEGKVGYVQLWMLPNGSKTFTPIPQ